MGREVRMVPADWQHPTNGQYPDGQIRYVPLFDGRDYGRRAAEWDEGSAKWATGWRPDYCSEKGRAMTYEEYTGPRPRAEDYMPNWPESERTHLMMYEDTSEGTPISPAFETPEQLARWLADTGASSFGSMAATYEQWLVVARGGWAPGLVIDDGVMRSGVQALLP